MLRARRSSLATIVASSLAVVGCGSSSQGAAPGQDAAADATSGDDTAVEDTASGDAPADAPADASSADSHVADAASDATIDAGPTSPWHAYGTGQGQVQGLFVGAPNDVFIAGMGGVTRGDGSTWSKTSLTTGGSADQVESMHGKSATDLWAAADFRVWHFDGATWSVSSPWTPRRFAGVWETAPNDVWAVGETTYHFDGTAWATVSMPIQPSAVWGASSTDAWAVGGSGFARWDGTAWTKIAAPVAVAFAAVRGFASNDVYAAGGTRGHGTVVHFDGTTWSPVTVPTTEALVSVYATGSSVWIGGSNGTLLHRNAAGAWSALDTGTSDAIVGIAGTDTDLWIAGTSGAVLHFDGTDWIAHSFSAGASYTGVAGTGPDDVFLVATRLAPPAGGAKGEVWHRSAKGWRSVGTTPEALGVVVASAPSEAFVGGELECVYRSDGASLASIRPALAPGMSPTPTTTSLWSPASGQVWAGTYGGDISSWDGTKWTHVHGTTFGQAEALWGSSPSDVWIGEGLDMEHLSGATWSTVTTMGAHSYWGRGASDIWGTNTDGVLHYDGTSWTVVSTITTYPLTIAGSGPTDIWAASYDKVIHFDGTSWSFDPAPAYDTHQIWIDATGLGWLAEDRGVLTKAPNP